MKKQNVQQSSKYASIQHTQRVYCHKNNFSYFVIGFCFLCWWWFFCCRYILCRPEGDYFDFVDRFFRRPQCLFFRTSQNDTNCYTIQISLSGWCKWCVRWKMYIFQRIITINVLSYTRLGKWWAKQKMSVKKTKPLALTVYRQLVKIYKKKPAISPICIHPFDSVLTYKWEMEKKRAHTHTHSLFGSLAAWLSPSILSSMDGMESHARAIFDVFSFSLVRLISRSLQLSRSPYLPFYTLYIIFAFEI